MRSDRSHLPPLILLLLLFSTLSYGQAWSNVLSPARAIDWSHAGLPATFPDGETTPNPWTPPTRTTICQTINPSGDASGATDSSNFNSAISACSTAGQVIKLAAGTFYINSDIYVQSHSNVTFRGSGACNNASVCTIIQGNNHVFWLGGGSSGTTGYLTATSYAAGTTTVTVASNPPTVDSVALFWQCDTGWSGTPTSSCNTGAYADNGQIYVCGGDPSCATQTGAGNHNAEQQYVYVTGVSGNTVTFTPGLRAPNWSSNRSATLNWGGFAVGIGIEDLNLIYSRIAINGCYACWAKGNRIIVQSSDAALSGVSDLNCLISNNYVDNTYLANNYPVIVLESAGEEGLSDFLWLNNIIHNAIVEGGGSTSGVVFGYNYHRDTVTNDDYAGDYQHNAGDFFELREGNEWGAGRDDPTHGTHFFSTYFRNWFAGTDEPLTLTGNANAIQIGDWDRFANMIGNVVGWTTPGGTPYAGNYVNGTPPNLYWIDEFGNDPLTTASSMRWGNYNICTGNSHCNESGGDWDSSEVPTSTVMPTSAYPNAGPWQNPVPSNNSLPCSFFLQGFAASTTCSGYPSGGTGLSWWKVCDTWSTFPTSCSHYTTQPFPPIGPDVTGGRSDTGGYAYDIPAAVAWKNLPIDTSFQSSYTVTGSSWSSGTETLTFASGVLPQCQVGNVCHLQGGFQLTTSNSSYQAACTGGLSEVLITSAGPSGSMPTSITYTLASNPGSNNCTGTMYFPDVRQFDERVFQNDPAGDPTVNPPTGLSAVVN
jgi:hypothetical protein